MKKNSLAIILVVILLAVAMSTNPNKTQYAAWMKEETIKQSDNSLEQLLLSWGSGLITNNLTTSKDYLFFTLYNTQVGDEYIKVVGAFNRFMVIGKEKTH